MTGGREWSGVRRGKKESRMESSRVESSRIEQINEQRYTRTHARTSVFGMADDAHASAAAAAAADDKPKGETHTKLAPLDG